VRTEFGPVLAAGAVVVGARTGEHLLWAARPVVALVVGAGPALLTVGAARRARRAAGLACLAALAAVSMARAVAGLDGPAARLAAGDVEAPAVVRLAGDPQGRWNQVRVPARLEGLDGRRGRGTVLVVATEAAAGRLRLLEAGESAGLVGRFRALEAAEGQWRWRHVAAVYEAHDLVAAGPAMPVLLRSANALRARVLAGGESLGQTDRALVAGFLVGDDRDLPPAVAADFRAAGLSHLLVVSGANVTLALALAGPVLQRFRLVGRLVGGVAVLVVFCAMTRFEPSVLRAAGMSGLALLAAFLGRPVAGLRILALATTGLLLVDPFLVHSLGFGLSCGASAGILLLAGPLAQRVPGPRVVREPLAVTAAAQIGVAPVALPAFGHLPLAALPANLAAAPAAAALSVWGLGSGLAGGLVGNAGVGPAAVLQIPTALLAGWIRAVAHLAARSPVMMGGRAGALVAAGLLVWWVRSGPGPNRIPVVGRHIGVRVRLETEPVVDGEQARPGEEQGRSRHGVQQVEFEAAATGLTEHAGVPLHLRHEQQELGRRQGAPQPGQQAESQADPAHQLDDDRRPRQQLGERKPVPIDGRDEPADPAVELLPPVVGEHRTHHDPDGEQRRAGRQRPTDER
jgi:competence protein ComEC